MKIENDTKISLLDSLVKGTQSKPQKEAATERKRLGILSTKLNCLPEIRKSMS